MIQGYTYIQAISENYPTVQVSGPDDGSVYETLVWQDGDALPSKAQLDSDILTLNIDRVWLAIKAMRDLRSQTGGYKVGSFWFHSDQTSRTQQIALVMLGSNIPANLQWKTMTGVFTTMTQTLAAQVFGAAVQSDNTIFNVAQQHYANVQAAADPLAYDFSGSWPQTFQESQA